MPKLNNRQSRWILNHRPTISGSVIEILLLRLSTLDRICFSQERECIGKARNMLD